MIEIIGIRFKEVGKIYYFSPGKHTLSVGDKVIVETARGVECGEVVIPNRKVDSEAVVQPLKTIIRTVTADDLKTIAENEKKEAEIMKVFVKKIEEHKLNMKAIDVEYTFDGSKILFYFTAESRVELRQIGVRDEAKMLGGLGICGRPFCCSSFLGEFQPVSIKMAKEQSLSLNPTKISGTCGRLMCCLKYEQDCYEELLKITPKVDAYVETAEGRGVVVDTNILTGVIKVRLDKKQDSPPITVKRDDVKVIKDAKIRVNRDEIAALKGLED